MPVHGGHQSLAWRGDLDGQDGQDGQEVIVKAIAAAHTTRAAMAERWRLQAALADRTRLVCRPVALGPDAILSIDVPDLGPAFVAAFRFVDGVHADPTAAVDVTAMGTALADLHTIMRGLGPSTVGPMRTLVGTTPREGAPQVVQIVHGDFTDRNVLRGPAGLTVIDFDECGYATIEQDLANTLHSVRFDAWLRDDLNRYDCFRSTFLGAYEQTADRAVSEGAVVHALGARAQVLAMWLATDLAPPGIASADDAWRRTLEAFVAQTRLMH